MATEKRLISLDEAIAKVKDDGILGEGYSDDERIDDVCDILESCKIVDAVEVVHAFWINKKYKIACSVCNNSVFLGTSDPRIQKEEKKNYKYCPNCGAKMDGVSDG